MASKQDQQDQENLPPRVSRTRRTTSYSKIPRRNLGVIDQNKLTNTRNVPDTTKQPFTQSNHMNVLKNNKDDWKTTKSEKNLQLDACQPLEEATISKPCTSNNKENYAVNERNNDRNIVNPIIPVAQFEAFKVYEDEGERRTRIDEKSMAMKKTNVFTEINSGHEHEGDKYKNDEKTAEARRKVSNEENIGSTASPLNDNLKRKFIVPDKLKHDDSLILELYSSDIYNYMKEHELHNRPKPTYIRKQPDVTANMRAVLVDWLVEVSEEYKLHTETLYLAVSYIDRFLSYMSVVRSKLQLVGTSAMFIASKYEEIYPPEIAEFVYITDDTYTKRQVIRMEHLIVKVLNYELSAPTPLAFITAICMMNKFENEVKFLAMYICELSLLEGEQYLMFLPSTLAISAIVIANTHLKNPIWAATFEESIGYTFLQLVPCMEFLCRIWKGAATNPQHAIQDKYRSVKYSHVSQLSTEVDVESIVNSINMEEMCRKVDGQQKNESEEQL